MSFWISRPQDSATYKMGCWLMFVVEKLSLMNVKEARVTTK